MNIPQFQDQLQTQLAYMGYELLCLEKTSNYGQDTLRLYIDHLDAPTKGIKIQLEDCAKVHEGLLGWTDVHFPDLRDSWALEVSSPGMERPLVTAAHFERFQGRLIRVQTALPINGQKKFKGWVGPVTPTTVAIEEDGQIKTIELSIIQKARLAPFDEDTTPQPKQFTARRSALPQPEADLS